jgi:hypothetical protein
MFVRRCETLDITGTFELTKAVSSAQGYTIVGALIYAWRANGLVPLVQEDKFAIWLWVLLVGKQ